MGRKNNNHSIETALVREKAESLSSGQLADEINRCRRGMAVGANKAARDRFERRLGIMTAECDRRMKAAGGGR